MWRTLSRMWLRYRSRNAWKFVGWPDVIVRCPHLGDCRNLTPVIRLAAGNDGVGVVEAYACTECREYVLVRDWWIDVSYPHGSRVRQRGAMIWGEA